MLVLPSTFSFFFFNDTATTEIYTSFPTRRSSDLARKPDEVCRLAVGQVPAELSVFDEDRKSTRLNSSHGYISYAVFCLKKKKKLILYLPERSDVYIRHVRCQHSTGSL